MPLIADISPCRLAAVSLFCQPPLIFQLPLSCLSSDIAADDTLPPLRLRLIYAARRHYADTLRFASFVDAPLAPAMRRDAMRAAMRSASGTASAMFARTRARQRRKRRVRSARHVSAAKRAKLLRHCVWLYFSPRFSFFFRLPLFISRSLASPPFHFHFTFFRHGFATITPHFRRCAAAMQRAARRCDATPPARDIFATISIALSSPCRYYAMFFIFRRHYCRLIIITIFAISPIFFFATDCCVARHASPLRLMPIRLRCHIAEPIFFTCHSIIDSPRRFSVSAAEISLTFYAIADFIFDGFRQRHYADAIFAFAGFSPFRHAMPDAAAIDIIFAADFLLSVSFHYCQRFHFAAFAIATPTFFAADFIIFAMPLLHFTLAFLSAAILFFHHFSLFADADATLILF